MFTFKILHDIQKFRKERGCRRLMLTTKIGMKRVSHYYRGNQKLRYTVHNGDRLFCRHASLERSKEGARGKERVPMEPWIKWSVMDRTRQLQIVPFSSEFLGPHAISTRDEGSKSKRELYSANDVTWVYGKKMFS